MQMKSIHTSILRHIHKDNGTLTCRAHWIVTGKSGDKLKENIPSWLRIESPDTQNSYLPASKYWYYNKAARRNLPFTERFILTLYNSDTSDIIYSTEFCSLQNSVLHNRWHHLSLCSNSRCLLYGTQSHIKTGQNHLLLRASVHSKSRHPFKQYTLYTTYSTPWQLYIILTIEQQHFRHETESKLEVLNPLFNQNLLLKRAKV